MNTRLPMAARRRWLAGLGRLGLAGLAAPWAHAAAPGSARVALVIGNAAYEAAPLLNPVRDARAMATLLGQLGFEVLALHDATQQQQREALARFGERLRERRATAMLYYAGHGVQIDWRNYLLPVDARLRSAADVQAQGLDVQDVIATCRAAGTHTNVLVLDACRDNPFGAGGGARGLAPMDAPPGTFFAYATAPGNVADDGNEADGNGLYTRYLLQELRRPQLRIEDVFKRVRLQVRLATQGRQIPWESTSLEEDIVFASGEVLAPPTVAERLRGFDEQRAAWARVSATARVEDLVAFVERDPGGPFAELAQFAIDRLAPPLVQAQAPQLLAAAGAAAPLAPGADRYRVGDAWAMQWTDHLRGTSERRPYEVTRLDGLRVLVNGGRMLMDQMGSIVENEFGRRDPGILMVPAELSTGRRWRSAYSSAPLDGSVISRVVVDHRVEGLDDIETPAGRFRAWRIAMTGQSVRPTSASDLRATLWVDAVSLWPLRAVRRFTARGRDWLEHSSTEEMVSMRRLPR
jgi:hypothetical protein